MREALEARAAIEVFVTELAAQRHDDLVDLAQEQGLPVHLMTDEVAESLSGTVTPQGIVAICSLPENSRWSSGDATGSLVVVLASVRDPGNAGTLIRIADAAGADAVLMSSDSVDPFNPKCVRASAGSLFHLPVFVTDDLPRALADLRSGGLQVWAASADGVSLEQLSAEALSAPTAWVFGNEAWGVTEEVRAASDEVVAVPIFGRAESLNVATAAAICLYVGRLARTPA